MVQFDTFTDPLTRKKLIALSPAKAPNAHATFNAYHVGFDPFNPINFSYLVIVHIPKGIPDL